MHRPSNSPTYSDIWTKSRVHGFPHLQRKTSGLTWPGNLVHTEAWFELPNNELYKPRDTYCFPDREGKLIYSLVFYWIQYPVHSPNHEVSLTKESGQSQSPSSILTWVGNHDSNLILFSASGIPSLIFVLRFQTVAWPQYTACPSCPKTLPADTLRNPNRADWWRIVSAEGNLQSLEEESDYSNVQIST